MMIMDDSNVSWIYLNESSGAFAKEIQSELTLTICGARRRRRSSWPFERRTSKRLLLLLLLVGLAYARPCLVRLLGRFLSRTRNSTRFRSGGGASVERAAS